MRILLSGGGTAGHINPAIAIADLIQKSNPQATLAFVGTPHGMENRLVTQAGYPIYHVDVRGFRRSLSPKNLKALYLAASSPRKAAAILSDFAPDLVIGTGGYVCYPILRAAARRNIPTAIHESNALPGLTVRTLAPRMDAIWLNFAESAQHLPRSCVAPKHTGNPLRHGFREFSREMARRQLGIAPREVFLLSFGGSLGADCINSSVFALFDRLHLRYPRLTLVHACGARHYDECRGRFARFAPRATLVPYLDNMPLYMAAADIVVSRAGAMTVSELANARKCAILVPSPHVTGNHQYENAATLANRGAAFLVEERELPGGRLADLFEDLLRHPEKRKLSETRIARFCVPDTNERILSEIKRLCDKKRNNPTNL